AFGETVSVLQKRNAVGRKSISVWRNRERFAKAKRRRTKECKRLTKAQKLKLKYKSLTEA
ncbi:MAG: hypothetical protein ACLTE4_14260, partial [Christensenellaceae bacterium]